MSTIVFTVSEIKYQNERIDHIQLIEFLLYFLIILFIFVNL